MAAYRMTPARQRALRKAQAASARKRRGRGKGKLAKANRRATRNKRIAIGAGVVGAVLIAHTASSATGHHRLIYSKNVSNRKRVLSAKHSNISVHGVRVGNNRYGVAIRRRKGN